MNQQPLHNIQIPDTDKAIDFLAIGHVTEDYLGAAPPIPGGTALYSGLCAKNLGLEAGLVTSFAEDYSGRDRFEGLQVAYLPAKASSLFRHTFSEGRRVQYLISRARPIGMAHIPEKWQRAPIVHLGPVINEVLLAEMSFPKQSLVCLSIQGLLRQRDEQGKIVRREVNGLLDFPPVDIITLSEEDIGGDEAQLAPIREKCRILIYTNGHQGARIFHQGERHFIPPLPTDEVDQTGAGDIFITAFLYEYHRSGDLLQAGHFASIAGSLAVEKLGIEAVPTARQIRERRAQAWRT